MSSEVYAVPVGWAESSHCNRTWHQAVYERSVKNPEGFWAEEGEHLGWVRKPTRKQEH
jgi:acetyl-CoA synthetase